MLAQLRKLGHELSSTGPSRDGQPLCSSTIVLATCWNAQMRDHFASSRLNREDPSLSAENGGVSIEKCSIARYRCVLDSRKYVSIFIKIEADFLLSKNLERYVTKVSPNKNGFFLRFENSAL